MFTILFKDGMIMDKILIGLFIFVLLIGATCGAFYLLNESNSQKMFEYIDTFSVEKTHEGQLVPQKDENGNWYFVTDENFKVLHLTDIHFGGGILSAKTDKMTANAVAAMVVAEKPDLVIVTGDISFAIPTTGTMNNKYAHEYFIRLMENLGVYWTVTFGNHETEPYNPLKRQDVADMYANENLERCLFMQSPDGVSGKGNHVINVKNTSGEVTQSLIMMDSHSYIRENFVGGLIDSLLWNYDNIKQNQIDWYQGVLEEYQPKSSLLFFHIPLMEVKTAYDEYVANGRELTDNVLGFTGNDGEKDDVVYPSKLGDNLFEKVLELGNTKAMFFGHDHFNNFVVEYKGVTFSYGYSIDYIAYGDIGSKGYQRGCAIVSLSPDGEFSITHENYYQDKYQPLYDKEMVDMDKDANK